ncbi:MAG: hypothetical protein RIK87_25010 [Fuerstiella sp.]
MSPAPPLFRSMPVSARVSLRVDLGGRTEKPVEEPTSTDEDHFNGRTAVTVKLADGLLKDAVGRSAAIILRIQSQETEA